MSVQGQRLCWLAVVVRDDTGRVLVARRGDTQAWDLPAGPLQVGEDVLSGVRRVVTESVTVGVSVLWLAGLHSQVRDGLTLVFSARHVTGRATPCGEVQTCRWVEPDVAVRMLWPLRAEQLRGALTNRTPQPVVIAEAPGPAPRLRAAASGAIG
jgi:ADP-ribose pyrophosphatase YjhB (NUDIX family)